MKYSPQGFSGDAAEPDEATTRRAIETELAKLPERYQPIIFVSEQGGYQLQVNYHPIFRDKPAHEAIERTLRYVAEHERYRWQLPTGILDAFL